MITYAEIMRALERASKEVASWPKAKRASMAPPAGPVCATCRGSGSVWLHEPSPAGGPDWVQAGCTDCGDGLRRRLEREDDQRYGNF